LSGLDRDGTPLAMTSNEKMQRRDLAAAHRLVSMEGWDDLVFTMLTARVPGEPDRLLVTPYGKMCGQVTASSLVKTDLDGTIIEGTGPIDELGFPIYGAIHRARPQVNCVLHVHSLDGVAVSAQAGGLLPLSQTSLFASNDLGYHDYAGVGDDGAQQGQLVADLGEHGYMLLRNHGTLTVGKSVADAYVRLHVLESACSIQVRALAGGVAVTQIASKIGAVVAPLALDFMDGPAGDTAWAALLARVEKAHPDFTD
jgi:ribulose-5-phosphate 4-epimerase/fuculose-1-phosphate aldolase